MHQGRQQNRPNLTSPLMLHSNFKSSLDHHTSPLYCKTSQNKLKKAQNLSFRFELGGAPGKAAGILYHMKSQKHQLLLLPNVLYHH